MIINYLYLISIGLAFMTIIFIIYNYILLAKRRKADHKDDNKKEDIIKGYKNNIMTFAVVLILSILFRFYYSRSVDIYKAVGTGRNINYESINIYGSITESNINLSAEKGEKLFYLLEKYKYKRIFNFNDITGDAEFILFEKTEGRTGIIEVWNSGYIRIQNNKLYKIASEDKEQLYIELSNLLENM